MKPTLALSSLLTLALLVFAAVQENYFTEWRVHQRAYKRLLHEVARDGNERELARRVEIELRQVVVPDLRRVDRCVSCHLGLEDPRLAGAPQPFTAHPPEILAQHDPERFGCTVCHGGQGRATTREEAHADRHEVFWEQPLLPAPLVQSSCGVCHDRGHLAARGAPVLARGRELFRAQGCGGCHRLGGRGGALGPVLDEVGAKSRHELPFAHVTGARTPWNWHEQHLRDPRKIVPASRMPKAALDETDLRALTTYLLSLRPSNLTEHMTPPDKHAERQRAVQPGAVAGEDLYRQFCVACHESGAETVLHDALGAVVPAIRNPDFLAVASEELLFRTIHDGRPESQMPAWGRESGGLSDGEIHALVGHLLESRTHVREVTFALSPNAEAADGKLIWDEICATCHSSAPGGAEGSWLGSPGFQRTYSDGLIGHTIKYGRGDTLMNPYGLEAGGDLTDEQISALVAFIRTMDPGAALER